MVKVTFLWGGICKSDFSDGRVGFAGDALWGIGERERGGACGVGVLIRASAGREAGAGAHDAVRGVRIVDNLQTLARLLSW